MGRQPQAMCSCGQGSQLRLSRAHPDLEPQTQNRGEGKEREQVSGSGLGCSTNPLSLKKPGCCWPVLVRRAGHLILNPRGLLGSGTGSGSSQGGTVNGALDLEQGDQAVQ